MQEPYEKGVAIHSAPSFAARVARGAVKRKQGYGRAGYRASKKLQSGRRRCRQSGRQYGLERQRELRDGPA